MSQQEPVFLILSDSCGSDGGHEFAVGYEPAARAVYKSLIFGEPEDDDANEYDLEIYRAVKDPESEEWSDAGPDGICWNFEDGWIKVVRIEATLPEAHFGVRPEVRAFAKLMEAKLRKKDPEYEGVSWKDACHHHLAELMGDHAEKLIDAVGKRSATQIGEDAADVANFAMMIADVCGALVQE